MTARTCPFCGAELKADVLGGLCPKCVLHKVMSEPEEEAGAGTPERPLLDPQPPSPRAAPERTSPTIPASATLTEQSGDRIGRYKLLQQLGEGGMGGVWMSPTNGLAYARLAKLVLAQKERDNPRRLGEADFFSRYALKWAPNDVEVAKIRAEIVAQMEALNRP